MFELRTVPVLVALAISLICSGCGSNESEATTAAESGVSKKGTAPPARVSVGAPHGRVLVSEKGQTLYIFDNDPKGGQPTCYGKCAKEWPPLLTSGQPIPLPNEEAKAALLGTVERKDGSVQVTYAGYPLYEYSHDRMTEARGFMADEFGGSWHLLTKNGVEVSENSPEKEPGATIVSTTKVRGLGTVLVNAKGFTIYDVRRDKGRVAHCYGKCTDVWQPVLAEGGPQARGAAIQVALGTTARKDGTVQVTYSEHPLYTSRLDKGPGERHGEDPRVRKGKWTGYALNPDGEEAFR